MYPDLFHIGPVAIRSYGLFIALAFFLGVIYVRWVTKRDGRPFEPYLLISYVLVFGGVIGARLTYVLLHLGEFAANWTAIFNPFAGREFGIAGMNLYGGVVAAIGLAVIYARLRRLSLLQTFDYFAPALGLGLFLGRIGCFCNGCCFGTPTALPWGVSYPIGAMPWFIYGDQPLHPTQLYSSLSGLGLFAITHALLGRKRFDGQVAAVFLIVESVLRFIIDGVRFYEHQMHFSLGGLHPTFNQFVSIALLIIGLGFYLSGRRLGLSHPPSR